MKNRDELIDQLLCAQKSAAEEFSNYINAQRSYTNEDKLYMREAHFIRNVGLDDGVAMSEIADKMKVTRGAVSQIAARLEKKGYIVRKKNKENRRTNLAFLTDKGKKFYQFHLKYDKQQYEQLNQDFLHEFNDKELELIIQFETKFAQYFKNYQKKD